jgi:thiol-disulfide isomerase/thioredoxin
VARKNRRPARSPKRKSRSTGSLHQLLERNSRLITGIVLVGLLVVAVVALAHPFGSSTATDQTGRKIETGPVAALGASPTKGNLAPGFVLADYDGNAVRLDQFRGKVVFLNFWATWCTACEAEMPDMNRLAKDHPDDLIVLAVNRGESPGQARRWSDARKLDALHFVVDPKESISRAYRLPNSMPNSYFVDGDGYVTRVIPGAQSGSQMERNFQEAQNASRLGGQAPN